LIFLALLGLTWDPDRAMGLESNPIETDLIVRLRGTDPSGASGSAGAGSTVSAIRHRVNALVADLDPGWRPAFLGRTSAHRGPAPALDLSPVHVLRFPDTARRDAAALRLAAFPDVVYVEPVFEIVAPPAPPEPEPAARPGSAAAVTPGDSLYAQQWSLALIGMPEVWAEGTGTPGILVAVVDTGIETDHYDLAPNIAINSMEAAGSAGVDDDQNGYPDDVLGWNVLDQNPDIDDGLGHGSHIAGIIGAASDQVRGTVGVTWEVGLLAVRMFDDIGRSTNLAGAQGIVYAADRGAHIINMSWTTARLSMPIRDAVDYAASKGAVLVASAGNGGGRVNDSFPAAFDPVIAVGASTQTDGLANFSNRGPRVDLVAPGVNILSTLRGGHVVFSGTSQSAALVSGVIAHLLYRHPHLRAEEVRSILRLAAVDRNRPGWDPSFGAGRLSAVAALREPAAPIAAILDPRTLDSTGVPALDVLADAEAASNADGPETEYVLDVGEGDDPLQFEAVAKGAGGHARHLGTLQLAERPEGDLTVRLRVRDASGREAEDRVVLRIDRTAPELHRRQNVNRLAGRRLEQLIRYESGERVTGRVRIREAGSGGEFEEFPSLEGATEHTASLTGLLPGPYEYLIQLRDLAGHERRIDAGKGAFFTRELLPIVDVPSEDFAVVASLEGFDLGAVADLDADGRPELLGELLTGAEPAGRLTVLTSGLGSAWPKFETLYQGAPGLPLSAGDVDGDGIPEILVGGNPGLTLFSGILGPKPQILWTSGLGDRRGGGSLADVDGDRDAEILFPTVQGSEPILLDWRGDEFVPIDLGFSQVTRAGGFAIADYDRDGRVEIALGTLSGELVIVESQGEAFVETVREPFLGRIANALVAAHVGDADCDGRLEFAISAVGTLLDRQERPSLAVFEAVGDDRYELASKLEFRDKNIPYDNWLAAGNMDGDERPELAVAQAGGVYLLEADRDDRFLPVWYADRVGGGRVVIADLNGDQAAEILVSGRGASGPVTTVYARPPAPSPPALVWRAIVHPWGNEILWEAPDPAVEVLDLAIYRIKATTPGASGPLESDLVDRRIFERRGELTGADAFLDSERRSGSVEYALAYTVDAGTVRRRVLDAPQAATPKPGAPELVLLPAHPNPMSAELDEVVVPVFLAVPAPVRLSIIDVNGRIRRQLFSGRMEAGRHEVAWDGRDRHGHRLASGIYFVRVRSPLGNHASRLVLLR